VDVGAAAFIRQSLIDLARQNCAVLVISEELDELFDVADRIAVIAGGELSPVCQISETNREQIGLWMSGLWSQAA
jgi:simple sugar transport system ATP-binding protein